MEKTPQRLKTAVNFFELGLPKAEGIVECHSWHELLFLLLSNGDSSVSEVESQPEKIRGSNGKAYIPDARVKSNDGNRYVEIKSSAALERARPRIEPLLAEFVARRGATHAFVSHEELDRRQAEAMLQLRISRWVMQYRDEAIDDVCEAVYKTCCQVTELTLHELIDHHQRWSEQEVTGAVCLLIHASALRLVDLREGLGHRTRVSLPDVRRASNATAWQGEGT